MKKILIIFAALIIIGLSSISCKTAQDCPAYGQITEKEEDLA